MIPTPDPDCNQVILTASPNVTLRCIQAEGHVDQCDVWRTKAMDHKHRAWRGTDTEVSRYVGVHRRALPGEYVSQGASRLDAALRRGRMLVGAVRP